MDLDALLLEWLAADDAKRACVERRRAAGIEYEASAEYRAEWAPICDAFYLANDRLLAAAREIRERNARPRRTFIDPSKAQQNAADGAAAVAMERGSR